VVVVVQDLKENLKVSKLVLKQNQPCLASTLNKAKPDTGSVRGLDGLGGGQADDRSSD
jgi:hypothetical protein